MGGAPGSPGSHCIHLSSDTSAVYQPVFFLILPLSIIEHPCLRIIYYDSINLPFTMASQFYLILYECFKKSDDGEGTGYKVARKFAVRLSPGSPTLQNLKRASDQTLDFEIIEAIVSFETEQSYLSYNLFVLTSSTLVSILANRDLSSFPIARYTHTDGRKVTTGMERTSSSGLLRTS